MRTIAWILVVMFAFGAAHSLAASNTEDETALRQIKEIEWPRAYREQDTRLLDRLLATEFRSIDADGAWSSKAEELEYVRKHKMSHELRFVIKRLEIFENGTAVVAGTGIITERNGATVTVSEYQSSNVFIKRDHRWQAIASHISGIKERQADARGNGNRNGKT